MAVPSFLIDTSAGETPQSIAKKRAIIQQLMMPYGKASNIGEGVGQLFNGIAVGMQGRKLDKAESAGMAAGSTAKANILRALTGSAPIGEGAFPPAPKAPAQSAGVPSATGLDVAKKLQQDFGLTPEAAAGFAGNLAHESGNFKTLQEINPTVKGSRGGFGWAQWTGPRRRQFEAFAAQNGLDPTSPEANYGFLKTELQGPEGRVLKALQGVNDPNKAAQIVSNQFLRPGVPHMDSRISRTKAILEAMNSGGQTQIASAPNAYAPMANSMLDIKRAEAYTGDPNEMLSYLPAKPFTGDPNSMLQNGIARPANPVDVASLDPSIGMPQQMYVGQVNPNGSIGTTTQPAPQQPIPQQAPQPQQVAQAAPQATQGQGMAIQDAGTPFERMAPQQGGMNLEMLIQQAQNPWLDDQSKAMVNSMIEREMQKQDPAYQLQQQQAQIGLQKDQLELKNLQNPQPKYENIGGKLVQINPDGTPKVVYDPPAPVSTEITDVNGKRVLINKATGMPIRELGDSPSKQQNAPAGYQMNPDGTSMSRIPGYRDTNLEMDMRKEFDAQSKDFRAVRDSYNRIQASAENPTPAGDLSLIFNYMKMLDPGSVVREAEFATAANAAPLLTRFGLDAEKLKGVWEGQRLTPEQRADFLTRADQLYQEQDQTFQSLADQYTETAKRNDLDPNNIILTPRANPRKKKTGPVVVDGYTIEEVDN